uniref:Uncharacterized protein n=1 Tax=Glossina pallidipes TaxID=7398 RepID=A0A1B0ACW4_GLOPL
MQNNRLRILNENILGWRERDFGVLSCLHSNQFQSLTTSRGKKRNKDGGTAMCISGYSELMKLWKYSKPMISVPLEQKLGNNFKAINAFVNEKT